MTTPCPMEHHLCCDECGDATVELREIERGGWGDEIICAACFPATAEAGECDFTDYKIAQEAMK